MIHVDEMTDHGPPQGRWCHLWSSTLDNEELMNFAIDIGCDPKWFQLSHGKIVKDFPHFDLRESFRTRAIKHGAVPKKLSDWLKEQMK